MVERYRTTVSSVSTHHRKSVVSFTLLACMGLSVLYLGEFGMVVFSIGTLLLGTDYEVLNYVGLRGVHRWLHPRSRYARLAEELSNAYYLDAFPVQHWSGDSGHATVPDPENRVKAGMEFGVMVFESMPIVPGEGEMQYLARLGSVEVDEIVELNGSKVLILKSVSWSERLPKDADKDLVADLRDGSWDADVFLKYLPNLDEFDDIGPERWEALMESILEEIDNTYGEPFENGTDRS